MQEYGLFLGDWFLLTWLHETKLMFSAYRGHLSFKPVKMEGSGITLEIHVTPYFVKQHTIRKCVWLKGVE